jgi:hypothetical protein
MMVLLEQSIRITLMLLLLERFQIVALIIAYFVGILVRGIVSFFVADKYCFPQRFYSWQSLASPVMAGVLQFAFLSLVAKLIWQNDEISSIILFFVALVPAMPVFFFFYALVGGWDKEGLDEVVDAGKMAEGFIRPVIRVLFITPSLWGAKVSPLHNRFPITMRPAAILEAESLTAERVKLVNP